jgi:hypothetical protein
MRLKTFSKLFCSLALACSLAISPTFGQTGGGGGTGGGGTGGGGTGGGGTGTVAASAAGVAGIDIDAAGVLRVTQVDPSVAFAERLATLQKQPRGTVVVSPLRKVSLNRLEKAVAQRAQAGQKIDDEMASLAGLTRIEYVFYMPDSKDIVIAGPAEKWHRDVNNRLVGLNSGKATLRLDDMIVALRAFAPNEGATTMIGCSIDPTQEGLKRMNAYNAQFGGQMPADVRGLVKGMRDSLGMQTVSVKGVPANTHFAQVLVEADYRMKLIGIGLQDPIIPMTTWIERSSPSSSTSGLQRWYFQADYSSVATNEAGTALRLQGRGVMLTGEKESVQNDGKRKRTGNVGDKASVGFTKEFTEKFDKLAEVLPVFAEMRNLFDMSVAAAFIQDRNLYEKSGWNLGVFGDERKLAVNVGTGITQVETAINAVFKESRLMTPIGGGVHIAARKLINPSSTVVDKDVESQRDKIAAPSDLSADQWWWD